MNDVHITVTASSIRGMAGAKLKRTISTQEGEAFLSLFGEQLKDALNTAAQEFVAKKFRE